MNPQFHNQESMLKESIKHFLTCYHRGNSDFSAFESIFFRLIQTMLDPPIEITWFYSAVTFHSAKSRFENNPFTRIVIAKDLLNLLISCSNLSNASKKIVLLAPIVYELHNVVCDTRKSDTCERMEAYKLIENVVTYVTMSAGVYNYGDEDVECDNGVAFFENLVQVWTTDQGGGNCNFAESLRIFFPLLTDGIWKRMNISCGIHELVGIVQCEVFFLKMYLCFSSGMCTEDYLKDTRDQMVQIINGFRNCFFLDMLLKMLLEPILPLAASLSSEDAMLLRETLFDAVILVDYSFYNGRWAHSDSFGHSKKLSLVWVLAADRAIQLARTTLDEAKGIAYLNAYRESRMVAELIQWVNSQMGTAFTNIRTENTTPSSLMNWLLALEDQGLQIFDDSMSLLRAEAVACVENEPRLHSLRDMDVQLNNRLPGDLQVMSMKRDGCRKRKEASSCVEESQIKQIKLDILADCAEKLSDDGSSYVNPVVISSDDVMDVDK